VAPTPRLETDRLLLRDWSPAARDALAELNADPVVMEFLPSVQDRARSDSLVDRIEAGFAAHGFGLWAVQRRDTGEFVGFCGLHVMDDDRPLAGQVEVGWRLARSAWGQGLATEAARAALGHGFGTAGLVEVMSMTARINVRSWRVMERLGMLRDRSADFDHPMLPRGDPLRRHVVHRIARASWRARQGGADRTTTPGLGTVLSVARDARHGFSKPVADEIRLLAGIGIEGDAHAGTTIQHRSRKRWRPDDPNPRQVHLLQAELLDELAPTYVVRPGDLGENVLTRGVDLLALPAGARLHLGDTVMLEVMGLRNPCVQIDRFADGLMAATLDRTEDGELVRRAGVMAVVLVGGRLRAGDAVRVELPPGPHQHLKPV
jgi:RimJ/RimL family protein N-acetyltransferase/MOSC domain-containing protein YiiM